MFIPQWIIAAAIFILFIIITLFYIMGKKVGELSANKNWEHNMPSLRKEIAKSSRSIIKGQVTEQIAPFLPGFPFDPAECKFIGSPIDFVVFQALDDPKNTSVVFVEVKTGQSKLNNNEKNLKEAIEKKRVSWHEYRVSL
jgi:predicted Holliday junction resolvase-like endonuclease